jgi:hypothetical protein
MLTYCFQKGAFCASIIIFNSLPHSLSILVNDKAKFQVALNKYLNTHLFYSVDEFFMCEDINTVYSVSPLQNSVYFMCFMTCSTCICLCDTYLDPCIV